MILGFSNINSEFMLEKPRIIEERRVCFRVTFRGLPRNYEKQRDRSERIQGSTNMNWVCEKRESSRIDAVYDKHSILDVG